MTCNPKFLLREDPDLRILDKTERLARIVPDVREAMYLRLSRSIHMEAQFHLEAIRNEIANQYPTEKRPWELPPALSVATQCAAIHTFRYCQDRLIISLSRSILEEAPQQPEKDDHE